MALARMFHLTCDCCGSPAELADTQGEARRAARTARWQVTGNNALCLRCIPFGHDRTGCLPEPDRKSCGFRWKATGRVGEYFHCVRAAGHNHDDGPRGGGGHTALPEWAGR